MADFPDATGSLTDLLHTRVLDVLGQAVVATDMAGCLVYCNRAAADLYGIDKMQEGKKITATLRAAIGVAEREELLVALAACRPWSGEVSLRRSSGREVPVHMTVAPVVDDGGVVTHMVTVANDL